MYLKSLLFSFFFLSLSLSVSAQTDTKKPATQYAKQEIGFSFSKWTVNEYAIAYKRRITTNVFGYCRLDLTSLDNSTSNTDTSMRKSYNQIGGTIGIEFRHQLYKKLKQGDWGYNPEQKYNWTPKALSIIHGPEFWYQSTSGKFSPNVPRPKTQNFGVGYGIGIMANKLFDKGQSITGTLQYIPGVYNYSVKEVNQEAVKSTKYRADMSAFFASIYFGFNKIKKDKK